MFDKEHFYFNKQAIVLTNIDEQDNSFEAQLPEGKKSEKLKPTILDNGERELTEFTITTFNKDKYVSVADYFREDIKSFIASIDYKEQPLAASNESLFAVFMARSDICG